MRRLLHGMVAVLCCMGCALGGQASPGRSTPDERLAEAQAEHDAASKLEDAAEYDQALARAEHALLLRETVLGGQHADVARSLNLVGMLFFRKGELARVEPLLRRALAIQETVLGPSHPDVAGTLHNLATLFYVQGLYDRAEPLYQRALALREAALGPDHPDLATSLNNLANLYSDQGLYGRAEPLYQRALALSEAALGPNHPLVANKLQGLAILYADQGLYGRAEPLYQRALAIREAVLGPNHPDVASTLHSLATLYADQGLYGRAEPLHRRALALREAALGPNHPSVADSLNSLAIFYAEQGLYDRAEPLHRRALALREAALGPNHPDVATSLNNLATLDSERGRHGQAEPLYQRVLALREAVLGPSHPYVATSLNNLANCYFEQGLLGQAEPLYQRALALREALLGKSHPLVARTLHNFAKLRLAQHRLDEALALFARAVPIYEQRLGLEALDFSESRLSSFLRFLRVQEETYYALLRAHPEDERVRRLALGLALLLKGRSVAETAHISRTVYQHLGPEDRDTFERLRALRLQLASLSFSGPGALSSEDYQARLQTLTDEGDALEALLAQRSAAFRALSPWPSPAGIVQRVAAALPADGALVEFITYNDKPLFPRPGTPLSAVPAPRYLALVLFPDGSTRAADLGPAAPIDTAAARLRDALATTNTPVQARARRLHRLVFQPLSPLLGTTRRLLLSPDGQLNLVPFAALHDGRDFLLSSHDITYLTSGAQLLSRPEAPPASSIIVLADPDFSSASPPAEPSSEALTRVFSRSDLSLPALKPLPGTRQEARDIQRLWPQAQLFLGAEATKQRLLHLPTPPGILHVATHGFFLGEATAPSTSRGLGQDSPSPGSGLSPQQEPLLNSGLVLAAAPRLDGSLVTALELAGINLWGTQLVVLSACDTGLGEVQLGQGIQGLRRALGVAGAQTVVMSLWKVRDDSTAMLMDAYYRGLLAGQGRASALREAMRSLRASPRLAHPHHWAPFIALGSDAPLHAISASPPR